MEKYIKSVSEIKETYKKNLLKRKDWIESLLPTVASENEHEFYLEELSRIKEEIIT
jgi:hypothetical protein